MARKFKTFDLFEVEIKYYFLFKVFLMVHVKMRSVLWQVSTSIYRVSTVFGLDEVKY